MEELQFNDGHWDEALKVLKREERKAWLRTWLPWMLWSIAGIVVFALLFIPYPTDGQDQFAENGEEIEAQHVLEGTQNSEETNLDDDPHSEKEGLDSVEEFSTETSTESFDVSPDRVQAQEKDSSGSLTSSKKERGSTISNSELVLAPEKVSQTESKSQPSSQNLVVDDTLAVTNTTNSSSDSSPFKFAKENVEATDQPVSLANSSAGTTKQSMPPASIENSMLNLKKQSTHSSPKNFAGSRQMPSLSFNVPTIRMGPSIKYGNYDYDRLFPRKADHKFILGGQSFLAGFGSKSGETFFNPEIGIGYEKVFGAHFSASAGISYFNIAGIQHVAEFSQTTFDFGFNTTLTQISTNKLHFAYLPLQANWDFTRRSSLTGGIGVSYLINGLSLVTVSEIDNFSETEIDRFEKWGYVGGYKSVNASLLAGYEFRLTPDWTFGLQYQYGLTKITKEEIYGISREDRNSRLRATLKYSIWR